MSITAKLRIEHDRLALSPTLRRLESVDMRVVSQGTTMPGATAFPFFVEYDDRETLELALDADETVASYDAVDWQDGSGVYYIEHTPQTKLISPIVTDVNGFLVNTESNGDGWLVRILVPDREALHEVWEYARAQEIGVEIIEIHGKEAVVEDEFYGLTQKQKVALNTAYTRGYFSEPREVSLNEIAAEMGLSSTAISGRIRRGMRNLVAATIAETDGYE